MRIWFQGRYLKFFSNQKIPVLKIRFALKVKKIILTLFNQMFSIKFWSKVVKK